MLGDALRELRKKSKLTQEGIAKKLGIPRSTYSNYETGKREPDLKTINEIADLYDVSVNDLAGNNSNTKELDIDIDLHNTQDIIKKYNLKIDGKPMTEEEARGFLTFVRTNRSIK